MAGYYSTALGKDFSNIFQATFTGSTNRTLSNIQSGGTALVYASYSLGTQVGSCGYQDYPGADISSFLQPIAGGQLFTTSNFTFDWTVPQGVTSICILCVGGSGGAWNRGTIGNGSWFGGTSTSPIISGSTVICYAGGGSGTGSGAGNGTEWWGNNSATLVATVTQYQSGQNFAGGSGRAASNGGGGGAAGYSGAGGSAAGGTGLAGAGGGGGGGNTGRGGGGVGMYPTAITNGAANGGGGSGGQSATTSTGGLYGGGWCYGNTVGHWGGGGGALAYINNYPVTPGDVYKVKVGIKGGISTGGGGTSGGGAVRIIWGAGRSFPITLVSTAYNETTN